MTHTADITALCRALDRGEDDVLPILADALEEAGDGLADAVRTVAEWALLEHPGMPCQPHDRGGSWYWSRRSDTPYPARPDVIADDIYDHLTGGRLHSTFARSYASRSAALLALAEALATE